MKRKAWTISRRESKSWKLNSKESYKKAEIGRRNYNHKRKITYWANRKAKAKI